MKRRLEIRPGAAHDLLEQAAYIALDSDEASVRFQEAAAGAIQRLLDMPEVGAPRGGLNPRLTGLRMWPIPEFPKHLIW